MKYELDQECRINGALGKITNRITWYDFSGIPFIRYTVTFYDKDLIPPSMDFYEHELERHQILPYTGKKDNCCCGAHKTAFPQFHSTYCPEYRVLGPANSDYK